MKVKSHVKATHLQNYLVNLCVSMKNTLSLRYENEPFKVGSKNYVGLFFEPLARRSQLI